MAKSIWADAVFGPADPKPKRPKPRKAKQVLVRKGR